MIADSRDAIFIGFRLPQRSARERRFPSRSAFGEDEILGADYLP